MNNKTQKNKYFPSDKKTSTIHIRVWQRLFLVLIVIFLLMLSGTALLDWQVHNTYTEERNSASLSESGWKKSVTGYVRAEEGAVEVQIYTEGLSPMTTCGRGIAVELENWNTFVADDGTEYYHIFYDGQRGYISSDNIQETNENILRESQIFVRTATNLRESPSTTTLSTFVDKGTALNVLGYDYLMDSGTAHMYQVQYGENIGWISSEYVALSFLDSMENWNSENDSYVSHSSRGNAYDGGDPKDLDYFPRETPDFSSSGNTSPESCYSIHIYMNSDSIANIDDYIEYAQSTEINTFVFTLCDDSCLAYDSPYIQEFGLLDQYSVSNTAADYAVAVQKVQDAGFYTIGQITTFEDSVMANARPDTAICYSDGTPYNFGYYCLSPYSREAWQYKVDFALEAIDLFHFNEICFTFVRFPYGMDEDTMNAHNSNGESRAQALQRFLLYARDLIHEKNAYISCGIYEEAAEAYTNAYGQYWPAISTVVDYLCALAYPEDFYSYELSDGYYYPVEHPYEVLFNWANKVNRRQAECSTPSTIRFWVQTTGTEDYPYTADVVEHEILALYDADLTGGYILTNDYNDMDLYEDLRSITSKDYYSLYLQAKENDEDLSDYMGIDVSDAYK